MILSLFGMRPSESLKQGAVIISISVILLAVSVNSNALVAGKRIDGKTKAIIESGGEVYLWCKPIRGDGYMSLTRRYCASEDRWREIYRINSRKTLKTDRWTLIPYRLLSIKWRKKCIQALFPDDKFKGSYWMHKITYGFEIQKGGIEEISKIFTGSEDKGRAILRYTGISYGDMRMGGYIKIPAEMLRDELQDSIFDDSPPPTMTPHPLQSELEYGQDEHGKYAIYRLKKGEALYSSVVIRFTGRVYAEEVNDLAAKIAKRNKIKDVTGIPVGFPVKIPFDYLLPEFFPPGAPQREAFEKHRSEVEQFKLSESAHNLEGVYVIIDPGHGGVDTGALRGRITEHEYCYDIACRLKAALERNTKATVIMTMRDKGHGYTPRDLRYLPRDRNELVLTRPNYQPTDARISTHLRWMIANYHCQRLEKKTSIDKIVFLSIHADSLHPGVRGTMFYVPDAKMIPLKFTARRSIFSNFTESREQRRFRTTRWRSNYSEGLSRNLAETSLGVIKTKGIPVHQEQPIRDKIYRGRAFVPAVLRYNRIPTKMLIEVLNMNNSQDLELLQDAGFRQRFAEAIAESLTIYYGNRR